MFEKIMSHLKDRKSVIHNSQLIGPSIVAIFTFLVILICTFVYPQIQSKEQRKNDEYKMKQDTLKMFSKNITQTINYYRTMNEYDCKAINETNKERVKYYLDKSDEYYNKFASLDPSYEVVCDLVKLYYSDKTNKDVCIIGKNIDAFIITEYKNYDKNNKCVKSDKFKKSEEDLYKQYDSIIEEMVAELHGKGL